MANRYWVNGSGNWSDDTNHWASTSGGSPSAGNLPTSSDDVFINSNSGLSGGTITQDIASEANNLLCNTGFNFSIDSGWGDFQFYGSITFESGLTFTPGSSISLNATSTGKTITTAGVSISDFYIRGAGGGWTLQDNLTINSFYQMNGTFNANNHNVTATNVFYFEADIGLTPTVIMGSGIWETSNWTVNDTNGEVLTITPETSTIKMVESGEGASFSSDGHTYNNLYLPVTLESDIYGSNTFNNIKIDENSIVFFETTTTNISTLDAIGTAGNLIKLDAKIDPTKITDFQITGSELIANGGFTGGVSGWTLGSGWSYGTNNIVHTGNTADYSFSQSIAIEVNKYYLISFDIISTDENWGTTVDLGGVSYGFDLLPVGSHQGIIYTTDNTSPFVFSQNNEVVVDNISVKEVSFIGQFTISKSSGTVSCDYLDISNSNATGGATWYAGSHSIDTVNNDGWVFTDPPTGNNTTNFFQFF